MTDFIRKHALLVCSLWATACGGGASPADVAGEEMMAADRAFASATAERGIDGWLEYFAGDGIVYQADEVARGRAAVRRAMGPLLADSTVQLVWEPDEAVAAPDGRFGYTSGPYRLVRLADDSMLGHGRYLTVWRRTPEGWKVVADIGAAAQ